MFYGYIVLLKTYSKAVCSGKTYYHFESSHMTHSLEKFTPLAPCSYRLDRTCSCFHAVIEGDLQESCRGTFNKGME